MRKSKFILFIIRVDIGVLYCILKKEDEWLNINLILRNTKILIL